MTAFFRCGIRRGNEADLHGLVRFGAYWDVPSITMPTFVAPPCQRLSLPARALGLSRETRLGDQAKLAESAGH